MHVHWWAPAPFVPFLKCVYCPSRTLGKHDRSLDVFKQATYRPFRLCWFSTANQFLGIFGRALIRIEDDENAEIIGRYHIVTVAQYGFARGHQM
jgi:hypothetical protein